jgi:hypothetical protein
MFGSAPLALFSDAELAWSVVPVKGGQLPPEAFTDYDALLIGGANHDAVFTLVARSVGVTT